MDAKTVLRALKIAADAAKAAEQAYQKLPAQQQHTVQRQAQAAVSWILGRTAPTPPAPYPEHDAYKDLAKQFLQRAMADVEPEGTATLLDRDGNPIRRL